MPRDLMVILEDKPGTLAALGEALGQAGVNIEGCCCLSWEGRSVVHILVEDVDLARKAAQQAGLEVGEDRDVLVLDVEDRPGKLGSVARDIADAGVNIELVYLATSTRVVIGADDLDKARGTQ